MRMIDKDALMADIKATIEDSGCVNHEGEIMDCIEYADTIDAVPVVCGECERRVKSADLTDSVLCRYLGERQMRKTDYCSYGERKPERSEG